MHWAGWAGLLLLGSAVVAELTLRARHRRWEQRAAAAGLRPEDRENKGRQPAKGLRVVALGDSNTYGFGLPYGATYPALLTRRLNEQGPGGRVWNAGVNGQTVLHGLERLGRDVLARRPHVVIVGFGLNDGNLRRWPSDERAERAFSARHSWRWWEQLHLWKSAKARLTRWRRRRQWARPGDDFWNPRPEPRVRPEVFRRALVQLVRRVTRRTGRRVFLLTAIPAAVEPRQQEVYRHYNDLIRSVARESGVELVDLEKQLECLPPEGWRAADGVHLTEEGHRIVAEAIWQAWERAGVVHGS